LTDASTSIFNARGQIALKNTCATYAGLMRHSKLEAPGAQA
jgi:hypothetical protein